MQKQTILTWVITLFIKILSKLLIKLDNTSIYTEEFFELSKKLEEGYEYQISEKKKYPDIQIGWSKSVGNYKLTLDEKGFY